MLKNIDFPKLAKEKFETALNKQIPMREQYEALKFVKLYVDQMNLDFFNFFHQLKKDQKNAGQQWFYDGHQLTIKNHRGHRGTDGIFKRYVFGTENPEEDIPEETAWPEADQEYVPNPDDNN